MPHLFLRSLQCHSHSFPPRCVLVDFTRERCTRPFRHSLIHFVDNATRLPNPQFLMPSVHSLANLVRYIASGAHNQPVTPRPECDGRSVFLSFVSGHV